MFMFTFILLALAHIKEEFLHLSLSEGERSRGEAEAGDPQTSKTCTEHSLALPLSAMSHQLLCVLGELRAMP